MEGEEDYASASDSVEVITKDSLLAAQSDELSKLMDVLSLKESHARRLMADNHWDVEKILTTMVERDKNYLFEKAGVPVLESEDLATPELPPVVMCMVCMEDVPAAEITTMDCGHYFCNTCWTHSFIRKINEGQSKHISCMAFKCNTVCDEAKVRELVGAEQPILVKKFDRFLLESYVEDNKKVKWCPSVPHCGNAVRITSNDLCEVECTCGLAFCFGCLSEPHSPCPCRIWQLWGMKCRDASETENWITVNTKPCPNCKRLVEKSNGCNLIMCICKKPFCWLCGEATGFVHTYTTIEGHSCGQSTEAEKATEETAKEQLSRYDHYHTRYKAHADYVKLESKPRKTIQENISKLVEKEPFLSYSCWADNAFCRLLRSKQILSYTYPLAYFMFDEFDEELNKMEREVKTSLFEDQQQQLEANVESLSRCLEVPLEHYSANEIIKLRTEIIDRTVLVDKLCRRLYDFIENGLLGSLKVAHRIASYKSNGPEKASELNTSINNTKQ